MPSECGADHPSSSCSLRLLSFSRLFSRSTSRGSDRAIRCSENQGEQVGKSADEPDNHGPDNFRAGLVGFLGEGRNPRSIVEVQRRPLAYVAQSRPLLHFQPTGPGARLKLSAGRRVSIPQSRSSCVGHSPSLLFGAVLGWVYSVLARTDTNERIVIDVLVGALGAVAAALALGNNSVFDSVVAASLGAFAALAVLFVARGGLSPRHR